MSFTLALKVGIEGAEKAAANLGTLRTKLDDMGASPGVKQLSSDLQKQIDLYGNMSRAAALAYDIERGGLAGVSVEQKKVLIAQAAHLDELANKTNKSLGGMRGMAQNLGWQMQDVAVQMQMGTNAAVIFTQQGSQLVGAFNPLLGAVIAVGGALVGALLPSLFSTGKAAEEMANQAKHLTKELSDLSDAQQKIVNSATGYTIADQKKKYSELTKEIEEQAKKVRELNAENGKTKMVSTAGLGGGGGGVREITIDNTVALAAATKTLTEKQTAQITVLRQINDLENPHNAFLDNLREEVGLMGLKGKELAEYKAAREGLEGAAFKEAVALDLLRQQKEADKKASEDLVAAEKELKNQRENSVKAGTDFINNLTKSNVQLQKQLDIGHALTPAQQEMINLDQALATGKITLTAAQLAAAKSTIQNNSALLDQIDAERESRKLYEDNIATLNNKAITIEAEAKKQAEANKEMGLTKQALGELEIARINEQLRLAEQQVAIDDLLPSCNAETEAHRATLKALQDLASAKKDGVAVQAAVDANSEWTRTIDSIKNGLSDALMRAFENGKGYGAAFKSVLTNAFKTMLLEPQVKFLVNSAASTMPSVMGAGAGNSASGMGAMAAFNPYALAAVAVVASVNIWNKLQDEKFVKMTAEYKQAHQGLSQTLGEGLSKSDTINNSIEKLGRTGGEALGVNYKMLNTLIDIRTGIGNVASGFARTLIGGGDYESMGITEGYADTAGGFGRPVDFFNSWNITTMGDNSFTQFLNSITNGIGKAIYNKKTSVIDSGIKIFGDSLKNIMDGGVLQAQNYADTKTTKKYLGINAGSKTNRYTEDLDETFERQLTSVFANAGEALEIASKTFGLNFDDYINQLTIKTQDLSLKGLEGDALTKEIESFFGATMDSWAETILKETDVLLDFQEIGETAFDTMLRLASETELFVSYSSTLALNMHVAGLEAVYVTQAIADAAGGFDKLGSQLNSYYEDYFTAEEKQKFGLASLAQTLTGLGIKTVPQTREQFRALVEAQDLSTDAGQKQFASLLSLADAFADLIPATEAIVPATETVKSQIGNIFNSIANALKTMRGDSEELASLQYDQAKATLVTALAIAQAGGSLANFMGLNDAISAITNLDKNNFASALDYNLERGSAAGLLMQLQPYTAIDGSHANGLGRVPFDGYIAQLHKGERVQTASQAANSDSQYMEIRALRSEMQAGMVSIAQSNEKIAKVVSRWDGDGMPEVRGVS